MEKEFINELADVIRSFVDNLKKHMLALEREVNQLLKSKRSDTNTPTKTMKISKKWLPKENAHKAPITNIKMSIIKLVPVV